MGKERSRKALSQRIVDARSCETCRYCHSIMPAYETAYQNYCRKRVKDTTLGSYVPGRGRKTLTRWVCNLWELVGDTVPSYRGGVPKRKGS